MITLVMSLIGLAFIAYLTYDTMTSIRAVYACEWAWPEFKQLADVFLVMWWILVGLGIVTLTGLVNPFGWVPFV